MRTSRTLSLFNQHPEPPRGPGSFAVSLLVHGLLFGFLCYGIASQPQVRHRTERYELRRIDFHESPSPKPRPRITAPIPRSAGQAGKGAPPGRPALSAKALFPNLDSGPQTLVQPKAPFHLKIKEELPVPQVMIWTAEKTTPQAIVPPQPQPLTSSAAEPSLAPPNEEFEVAAIPLAASPLPSPVAPVQASATSPIRLEQPSALDLAPVISSNSTGEATPAAVLSLSDQTMREGTVLLPPLNESLRSNGDSLSAARAGGGNTSSGEGGASGAGKAAGNGKNAAGTPAAPSQAAPQRNLPALRPQPSLPQGARLDSGSSDPTLPESHLTAERITLPANGQFGMVVVGSSMQERYPETAQLWSGRLSYTVYLHVGAAKNWILQYTLPRETEAGAAGFIARLDAPWPYSIIRPNIPSDEINADALMVHGFVTTEGRFEALSVAFPPDFALKQFVLDSLTQWQFRPAMQNGRPVRVETLLIIPEIQ